MTAESIQSLSSTLPLALKRAQVVRILRHCGLGGADEYERLRSTGTLKPLRGLQGAKQARYGKEHVLSLCADALGLNA